MNKIPTRFGVFLFFKNDDSILDRDNLRDKMLSNPFLVYQFWIKNNPKKE